MCQLLTTYVDQRSNMHLQYLGPVINHKKSGLEKKVKK